MRKTKSLLLSIKICNNHDFVPSEVSNYIKILLSDSLSREVLLLINTLHVRYETFLFTTYDNCNMRSKAKVDPSAISFPTVI